ncbi:MAG: T9SS type A sorting domain-containing protein, partial [Dysgonamonadaceae bacterium]|nr:T9SS type A sorting domain-containing protein [Dysgonamonadaceae bacterium]
LQIEDDQIKIHFSKDENRQIAIYDISGRLHYREDFFSKKELIIPSASFSRGIYLLKLYSKDNNQVNIHKFIL